MEPILKVHDLCSCYGSSQALFGVVETSEAEQTSKVLELETAKPDTLAKTVLVEPQNKQEEKPAKKPKRKLPLNLKPSPDFMPVNPNF